MTSLTDTEKLLLFSVQFAARTPVEKIARQTGIRTHNVRYALRRLVERKIVVPYAFIEAEALGYTAYSLLCSLSSHQLAVQKRFERALVEHGHVAALQRIGGDHHYRCVLLAKSTHELLMLVDELVGKFGEIIFERSFAVRAESWLFSRKYLAPSSKPAKPLHLGPSAVSKSIDALDSRILHAVSRDGARPFAQIAHHLGVPASTVEYRVRKLESEAIIKGWVHSIAAHRFGMSEYKLLVSMKRIDAGTQRMFFTFCAKQPHVYNLMRCIGSWDYEVGLEVDSHDGVTTVVQSLYEAFASVVHTVKVIPVFDSLKGSMFPFNALEPTRENERN